MLFIVIIIISVFILFWYRKGIIRLLKKPIFVANKFTDIYLASMLLMIFAILITLYFIKVSHGYFKWNLIIVMLLTFLYYSLKYKNSHNSFFASEWSLIMFFSLIFILPKFIDFELN